MPRKVHGTASGHTILVVDDQEETLSSVRRLLEHEGHRILTADCGERALTLFKENEVHLLLVDYFMPRMTGEQLVREIRTFDPFVQIILQTGYAGEKPPRMTLADLDVQGYHDKAEGPEKLLLWVDAGLKAHRQLSRALDHERRITAQRAAAPFTVLVVDEPDTATTPLRAFLEAEGYRVLVAHNSGDALDLFVRERPHFVVIDDVLLDHSGVDLLRRIRVLDPATALIAQCDALDARQRRTVRHSLGLHGIYDKGDDPQRLLELLDSAVDGVRRIERTRADQSLRGLVLAKLCHDLRSYIDVVHGYTELLCGDPATASFSQVLTRLAAASDTARELVQAYLDLAQLESPGVMVRRELVNLEALVEDLRAQAERQIGSRPLRFAATAACSGAVVHTDGDKLRAILAQLLGNAIKFSVAGTIELSIRFAPDRTDFVLTDTGPDIAGIDLAALFEPFYQRSEEPRAGTPGQGLGSAIALRLSQLIGAALTADRGVNGGAIFTLSLPTAAFACAGAAAGPTLH